jgi:hypothetical protein
MDLKLDPDLLTTYHVALLALAADRARQGEVPHVLLPDAQFVARLRRDPAYMANVALDALTEKGVFVREIIGDGGAPVSPERVERLIRVLAGDDGTMRERAEDEARSIIVRWRLLEGSAS